MPTTTTDPAQLRAKAQAAEAEAARLSAEVAEADAADLRARQDAADSADLAEYASYDRAAVDADVDAKYQALLTAIRSDPTVVAYTEWAAARAARHRIYTERQARAEQWKQRHPDGRCPSYRPGRCHPSPASSYTSSCPASSPPSWLPVPRSWCKPPSRDLHPRA